MDKADSREDELTENRFFELLGTKFAKIYRNAQADQKLVVVPQASALVGLDVTEEVDGSTVSCVSGFQHGGDSAVIYEELFYNTDYKPYRVLCVDRVLNAPRNLIETKTDVEATCPGTAEELVDLLRDNVAGDAINEIDRIIAEFLDTYVVVKGYLEDLISRIARIRHEVISAALTGFSSSSIYREATIGTAAECYMDQNLFDSVYPAVAESCSDDSLKWNAALGRARMADDKAFGVRQEFLCDFSPAVASISPLVKCRTPFDMFTTIKETFQVINSCVAANLRYLRIEGESMTTDDLLPIVALILVRAAEPELVSLMEYTNRFGGSTTGISEFAFNHVTLEAAVAFIQSADFQKTLPLAQLPVTVPGQKDSDTRRRSYFEAIKHEHSAFPTSRPVDCQYGGRGDSRVMQERADSGNVGQDLNGVSVGSSALQELAGGQSIRPAYGIDAVGVAEKQAEAFLELQPNSSYDELLAHLRVSTTTNANQQFAMDVLAVIDDVYQCHVEALEATGRSTRPGDRNLVANRPREQSSRESGDAPENAFSPKVVAQTIATDDATATKEDMGDFLSALAQGW